MKRIYSIGIALLIACGLANARGDSPRGDILAKHVLTVADDFVVEVYHNGLKVPDARRTMLVEIFGASAERLDIEVKRGDWLVFNVVNNRLRWGGASYFAVSGRSDEGLPFTTELDSGRWSCCDDPDKVTRFVTNRDFLAENKAQPIANPWGEGDSLMTRVADGFSGKPLWGRSRNTWIKFVAR